VDKMRRKPWAWLLRHVFAINVTVCVTVQRKPRKNGPAVELAAWPVGGPAAQA
jgi:hypothetical protein